MRWRFTLAPTVMERAALIALASVLAAPLASSGPSNESARASQEASPTPVLVELFTSEGCSSCPPADTLLSRLVSEQPVAGIRIIALGEHVDYWNSLGWPDRFSSARFTRRQSLYGERVFPRSAVYTPQIVVDGTYQAVGSNAAAVRQAVREAAADTKADVRITADRIQDGGAQIALEIELGDGVVRDGPADTIIAVTEDELETAVERGENGGRTLSHDAVVRRLDVVAELGAQRDSLRLSTVIPIDDEWLRPNLRITAFVQERESRRVLGAASVTLAAPRAEHPTNQAEEE